MEHCHTQHRSCISVGVPLKRTASKQRQALPVMLMLTDAFGSEQKKGVQQADTVDKPNPFYHLLWWKWLSLMSCLASLFSKYCRIFLPRFRAGVFFVGNRCVWETSHWISLDGFVWCMELMVFPCWTGRFRSYPRKDHISPNHTGTFESTFPVWWDMFPRSLEGYSNQNFNTRAWWKMIISPLISGWWRNGIQIFWEI